MSKIYKVQKGDSLWQISNDNGLSLDEIIKLNPTKKNMIHPGDILRLEPNKITKTVDIRKERIRENKLNLSNITAIKGYNHKSNYAIIDKKNGSIEVYDKNNKLLYKSNGIATGLSTNDYNTVTYGGDSNFEDYAGNNSTPAGITVISSKGDYHGFTSFQRSRINLSTGKPNKVHPWVKDANGRWIEDTTKYVNDDIASAIHFYNDISKSHISNGCIRANEETIKNLSKYLDVGDNVYTLPEQKGSRFVLKNGRLNFVADNPYGTNKKGELSDKGHDMEKWDDYNVSIDKSYSPLKLTWEKTGNEEYDTNKRNFANSIVNNKREFQKKFNLTSDEYNHLAELALGIAEQESKFGTSTRYDIKENSQGLVSFLKNIIGNNSSNSRGYTQIKYNDDIKNKNLKNIYDSLRITDESLSNADNAAKATMARLAFIYNTEVKGRTFKNNNNQVIDPYDALMYKWNGKHRELTNKTATPEQNKYIKNVKKYSNNFNLYEIRDYYNYDDDRRSLRGNY